MSIDGVLQQEKKVTEELVTNHEDLDEVKEVVLDSITENMAYAVAMVRYGYFQRMTIRLVITSSSLRFCHTRCKKTLI